MTPFMSNSRHPATTTTTTGRGATATLLSDERQPMLDSVSSLCSENKSVLSVVVVVCLF